MFTDIMQQLNDNVLDQITGGTGNSQSVTVIVSGGTVKYSVNGAPYVSQSYTGSFNITVIHGHVV